MSSVSSSLPSGLQILSNDGLLPANVTAQQLQNATPSQITQMSMDNVELSAVAMLFGTADGSTGTANGTESVAATLLDESSSSTSNSANLLNYLA